MIFAVMGKGRMTMATCKECFGYKFCSRGKNGLTNFYGAEVACNNVEYLCNDFANKLDFQLVKHGYWYLLDDCANEGVYCSVCNKKVYKTDYANQRIKSNYCPNCGAKMGGVHNG